MSTEMNFIKHKWLLSEFNEFRKNDPVYLKMKEKREEWVKNNLDKIEKWKKKYVEKNREKINKKQMERYRAIAEIKKSYE